MCMARKAAVGSGASQPAGGTLVAADRYDLSDT